MSFVLGFICGAFCAVGYGVWRLVAILRRTA